MKQTALIYFIAVLALHAQSKTTFIKDTSFTLYSAYEKAVKEFPSVSRVKEVDKSSITIISNIEYARNEQRALHLDLFLPAKSTKGGNPVVIIIHGGGWRSGSKEMEHRLAEELALNGIASGTIEYTLSVEAEYPQAIFDIRNAYKWIKSNSSKYKINKSKIFFAGASSGGHLALLAGIISNKKVNKYSAVPKLAGIIDIDGVLDLTVASESGKDTIASKPSAAKQWLGQTYKENSALWIEASPLTYISKNTPPVLFINSALERFHAGRDEAVRILKEHKIHTEVNIFKNSPHTFWLFNPWFGQTSYFIINFVKKF